MYGLVTELYVNQGHNKLLMQLKHAAVISPYSEQARVFPNGTCEEKAH
jgi:hypothetical protein